MAGVLEEAPREAQVQRVDPGHGGREVIDDEVAGHAPEAGPGRLQALDHCAQLLAGGGPDEAVPRIAPDHNQRPHRALAPALGIGDQAEAAEVHLRHLARRPVLHPHGHRLPAAPAAALDEAPQRAVGDLAAALRQQLPDPRDLQALGRQPALDLLRQGASSCSLGVSACRGPDRLSVARWARRANTRRMPRSARRSRCTRILPAMDDFLDSASGWNWTAIGTIALAFVTIGLAGATVWLGWSTRRMVNATSDMALHTRGSLMPRRSAAWRSSAPTCG